MFYPFTCVPSKVQESCNKTRHLFFRRLTHLVKIIRLNPSAFLHHASVDTVLKVRHDRRVVVDGAAKDGLAHASSVGHLHATHRVIVITIAASTATSATASRTTVASAAAEPVAMTSHRRVVVYLIRLMLHAVMTTVVGSCHRVAVIEEVWIHVYIGWSLIHSHLGRRSYKNT